MSGASELVTGPDYSPAAQRLLEAFSSSADEQAEYERRGLIPTNNLGLRMQIYESGPTSELGEIFYDTMLTPQMRGLFEKTRAKEPELWSQAMAAYGLNCDLSSQFFEAAKKCGLKNPQTHQLEAQLEEAYWQDAELATRVFNVMDQEPLTPQEAIDLCI